MSFCESYDKPWSKKTLSIQENIESVQNHVRTFESELIEVEKEVENFRKIQRERWDKIISDGEYWFKKTSLEHQIKYLKEVLNFLENNENENTYIRNLVGEDLAVLASFNLKRSNYSKEIRAAYMRLDRLNNIEKNHLKETRRNNKTFRDIVKSLVIPCTEISVLTPESKKIAEKWFDLIAQEYLNTYFWDFIEIKKKKRWKCNPDELKTWEIKSKFDKNTFIQDWFPLTIQEFELLMNNAFKNATPDILKVFNNHPFSVKLHGKMTTISPVKINKKFSS